MKDLIIIGMLGALSSAAAYADAGGHVAGNKIVHNFGHSAASKASAIPAHSSSTNVAMLHRRHKRLQMPIAAPDPIQVTSVKKRHPRAHRVQQG